MINKNDKQIKNEKGITIITLIVTVLLLVIITSTIAMNTYSSMHLSKLTKLQNDIEALNDKVATYYVEHNELPKYKGDNENYKIKKSKLSSQIEDLAQSDGNDYYIIDLSKLSSIRLNYGQDYTSVTSNNKYIINEQTHIIYYLEGIVFEGENYHTIGKNQ